MSAIQVRTTTPDVVPSYELTVEELMAQMRKVQDAMREAMSQDIHYGVIPGTNKPTLLKPGAEKLCLLFRLDPEYDSQEHYEGKHLSIKTKCTLYHIPTGLRYGSGEGSCSTHESKYAFRKAGRSCPQCNAEAIIKGKVEYGGGFICFAKKGGCGAKYADNDPAILAQPVGRVPNEDLADCYNTILKMSAKRSLIAAVLNVTAASDIFGQDVEDLVDTEYAVHGQESRPAQSRHQGQENGDTQEPMDEKAKLIKNQVEPLRKATGEEVFMRLLGDLGYTDLKEMKADEIKAKFVPALAKAVREKQTQKPSQPAAKTENGKLIRPKDTAPMIECCEWLLTLLEQRFSTDEARRQWLLNATDGKIDEVLKLKGRSQIMSLGDTLVEELSDSPV